MRYVLARLALFGCLACATGLGAQSPTRSVAPAGASAVSAAALRAGVSLPTPMAATPGPPDTSATGAGSVRRRVAHSAIGAAAGLAAGAGAGALVGWGMDHHAGGDAGMYPASLVLGLAGGAGGLVVGAVAGAFVR